MRVRAGKGSRPRTKDRPDWSSKPLGRVIGIDRGRYQVSLEADGTRVVAVRARELGRGSVIMGDRVRLTGDLSGRPDTLARIVAVEERSSVLRRSLEDAPDQRGEKAIVANADTMCIVVALADPPPRTGMIDRCLVAAFEAGLSPILVLTKADLASADELIAAYEDFDLRVVLTSAEAGQADPGVAELRDLLAGHWSVLVGHSGGRKVHGSSTSWCRRGPRDGARQRGDGARAHTSTSSGGLRAGRGRLDRGYARRAFFRAGARERRRRARRLPGRRGGRLPGVCRCARTTRRSPRARLTLTRAPPVPSPSTRPGMAMRIGCAPSVFPRGSVRRLLEAVATAEAASKAAR